MNRFEVLPFIKYIRNKECGPFLLPRFKVRPFIRNVRNTEGGPFLMLRLKERSLDMLEILYFCSIDFKTHV